MKTIRTILALALVVSLQYGFAQVSTSIKGTSHDLSGASWNTNADLCDVCHTPHNSNTTVATAPLWDHQLTTFTGYQAYTSGTLDAGTLGDPDGISKLCLSCHDGTVALENYGSVTTGVTKLTVDSVGYVGTDLRNDHPVSFTYDAALVTADGGLHPITATSNLVGTIEEDLLSAGKVQCSSCHDPHNNEFGSFLIMTNASSKLCLTCHDK